VQLGRSCGSGPSAFASRASHSSSVIVRPWNASTIRSLAPAQRTRKWPGNEMPRASSPARRATAM
jgi:hypothetical protein